MKVRELIEALAQYDPEMDVVMYQPRYEAYDAVAVLEIAPFRRSQRWFDRTFPGEAHEVDCLVLDSKP